MSGLDRWDDGTGDRAEAWGRASDNRQVFQSRGNQYVTQVNLAAQAQGEAAHQAREHADVVVQVLARAVGDLTARCEDLEKKAKRAKAEGRAEAHAEFAERLRDAELRVMKAQRMMREAEQERANAESLLAHAQRELSRQQRKAERERAERVGSQYEQAAREAQETAQFDQIFEQAEVQLGAVRDELRLLSEQIQTREEGGPQTVLAGEVLHGEGDEWPDAGMPSDGTVSQGNDAEQRFEIGGFATAPAPAQSPRQHTRWGTALGVATFAAAALPLPIVGSAIRSMYSAKSPPAIIWGTLFDIVAVPTALVVTVFLSSLVAAVFQWSDGASDAGCAVHVVAGIGLFITGIVLDPGTWPWLTQAGRIVAEYLGPL
ncbi:hypothetical protein EJC51_13320 [Streptomyces aquilus]|uniref:Uncharacterized protein n=1 Tax=Streptomyces aquilus TaxID=2548456 RepID=A0A3S9HY31_9ACTN|nr:V-type ATP synthase subunit E [Streptomyces aquilus]AZP17010.1 hypothetical protein EJC51_13320 [Streptomyces aquilus]